MSIIESLLYNFYKQLKKYQKYHNFYKPAVVFDIDGTILKDDVYSPKNKNDLILDVYNFLLQLQKMNIKIFIVTARPDNILNRRYTEKMLQKLGINYEYVYMFDSLIFDDDVPTYKEMSREDIFIQGYNVLMSLGDNNWDYGVYGGLGVHIYDNGDYIEYIP